MKIVLKYFLFSMVFTIICLALGLSYAIYTQDSVAGIANIMVLIVALALLELSLSFDNAIINAKILTTMSKKWQRRFLTWGILISVFGVRIILPVFIVAVSASLGLFDVVRLALVNPEGYASILAESHYVISPFAGAFLMMVALFYFSEEGKSVFWITPMEKAISKLGFMTGLPTVIVMVLLVSVSAIMVDIDKGKYITNVLIAGIIGIIVFEVVHAISTVLDRLSGSVLLSGGLAGFIYLNVLDSTFSLDGVVGALAVSNDIVIISLGLAIGAIFVRSLTIFTADYNIVAKFKYIEHGAYWSILLLGIMMFLSVLIHIEGLVIAAASIGIIAVAFVHSVISIIRDGKGKNKGKNKSSAVLDEQ